MTDKRFDTQDLKNAQQGIYWEGVTSKPGYSGTSEYYSDMSYDNKSVEVTPSDGMRIETPKAGCSTVPDGMSLGPPSGGIRIETACRG